MRLGNERVFQGQPALHFVLANEDACLAVMCLAKRWRARWNRRPAEAKSPRAFQGQHACLAVLAGGMRLSMQRAWERAGARVPTDAPRRQSYLACLDATSVRVSCLTAQGPRGAQPVPASSSPTSRPHATPDAHAGRSLNRDPCPAPARLHGHAKVAVSAPFATARAYDPSPRSKVEVPIDPSRAADASGALSGG